MLKKTIIILGGVASLMFANSAANAQNYGNSAYCSDAARRVAYRSDDPSAVIGGALTGAVLGGVVGAVTGNGQASNIGTGAAVGGVAGGVVGAGSQRHYSQRAYDQAYSDCINNSRFRDRARPIRYSRSQDRYSRSQDRCVARYRSYNPATGFYVSASGQLRRCR